MDREPEELRGLGVGGICTEAYILFRVNVRLFLSLALTLVLPLGVFLFCYGFFFNSTWQNTVRSSDQLAPPGADSPSTPRMDGVDYGADCELYVKSVMSVVYAICANAFFLLSTAAIVFTVGSIYTGKGLSYSRVISVLPKVYTRLFFTFLWALLLIFIYCAAFLLILILQPFLRLPSLVRFWFLLALVTLSFCLLVYFYVVWLLASVVSVLEDGYGMGALRKSAELIKEKRWVGCTVFLIYTVCASLVLNIFTSLVKSPDPVHSNVGRGCFGLILLLLWTAATLFVVLVQSVLYFVCKSYHDESIDRGTLSAHLDSYLGKYSPLKGSVNWDAELEDLEEV